MIVRITAAAERDLEAIGDYIALDSPRRALTFIQDLRAKCDDLATLPERFPFVPRYRSVGVRRRVYGNYLIFFRVEPDSVTVLHLLSGFMDYDAGLFPD
ncbi:type II toxin-antitoxin system RelE/ParE family toxin [Phenylobacterium sp.]|jgi:plasmid stabilization system protein ParE|uniref:type II toxin-antitoxin system RelE/ParE family toxin n=1 Tax=Phenylobacterium sp. TaxID=1871053 RepID=UPI0037C9EDD0